MIFSLSDEVYIFLYSALSGALIMLFYDILSTAFKKKECPVFVYYVSDGLFVIVACAILLFVNLSVSNGIVRGFEFFGALLGGLIYKIIFSRLVLLILLKFTIFTTAFFKIFFKIVLTPLEIMYKMLSKCINVLLCPAKKLLKNIFSFVFYKTRSSFKTARKAIRKT